VESIDLRDMDEKMDRINKELLIISWCMPPMLYPVLFRLAV
jgi:hypothetical protein